MYKSFKPGAAVIWSNQAYRIEQIKNLTDAVIANDEGNFEIVRISELKLAKPKPLRAPRYSARVATDEEWERAVERLNIIRPLLDMPQRTKADVEKVAKQNQKGSATIYRWLRQFETTGVTTSLLREKRVDKGAYRLDPEVEEIINLGIERHYLKEERKTVVDTYDQIKAYCYEAGVNPPSLMTVHKRIKDIDAKTKTIKRQSRSAANQKFTPYPGSFPHDGIPYGVVQIDHTPMDVIIVDNEHRLPIGKPYLTIAIDIATKMLGGFVLDLYAPSALTAGLCISHAMMTKDSWLSLHNLDYSWPLHGRIQKIHVDNASEFRGTMVMRGCDQHDTVLENRPKGNPRYGGHVERGFRTFLTKAHGLPGSTHGSVARKLDYDSEGKACFTLDELYEWFATYILGYYHQDEHNGQNGQPPIKRFEQLVLGNKEIPGLGSPVPIEDEETMKLDFMPFALRTIQRTGVKLNTFEYYSPALDRWIGEPDPETPSKIRKFVFAQDPRSLKQIYFFDPDLEQYFTIPCKNSSSPDISLWEYKAAVAEIKKSEFMQVDEETIIKTVIRLREQEQEAIQKTLAKKKARAIEKRKLRNQEKRRRALIDGAQKPNLEHQNNGENSDPTNPLSDDIKPFDVEM